MAAITRRSAGRNQSGTAVSEFAAGLVLFFCFFFIPAIDMAFVPVRYMLVNTMLEKVVHHMALCEKRTQALQYLKDGSWKALVERLGVTVKDARATLLVRDNSGSNQLSLSGTTDVPAAWLPNSGKHGAAPIYALELAVDVDIPPLFNNKAGLPGFNSPIAMTFRNRDEWQNVSPDPLSTADPNTVRYFINE